VGTEKVDVSSGSYIGDNFKIESVHSDVNPEEDFIILDASERCDIKVGFYGHELESVAIVDVPCKHAGSGRMIGLCGDCDGNTNDLRTLDGTDVSSSDNMFLEISESYQVDDSVDNIEEIFSEK